MQILFWIVSDKYLLLSSYWLIVVCCPHGYAVLMVGIVALYGCYHGWLLYAIHKVCSKIVPVNASWLIVEFCQLPLIVVIMVDCCMLSLQLVLSNCNRLSMPFFIIFDFSMLSLLVCYMLPSSMFFWLYPSTSAITAVVALVMMLWIVPGLSICRCHDWLLHCTRLMCFVIVMVDCWVELY